MPTPRDLSSKPAKSRRRALLAPLHKKSKWVRAPLSKELRSTYHIRSLRVRTGDTVKVMRGGYKGLEGKVTRVFVREGRIAIEGLTRQTSRGRTVPIRIHASKVTLVGLNLEDKRRKEKLEKLAKLRAEVKA
ncbi:MAG: 50S ribosomal protein L24 [Nitrososphaerota archaeon]